MGLEDKLQVVKQSYVANVYTLPEKLRREGIPSKIGMRELSSDEELTASKLGRFHLLKAQHEAVKLSICSLDGKETNNANGEVDLLWAKCGPKIRSLLLSAYEKLSSPSGEEEKGFFESLTQEV